MYTYHERNTLVMSDLGNRLEIEDVVAGVSNGFDEHRLGLVINSGSEVLNLVPVDKLCVDPKTREKDLKLVVRSSVEVGSGDDVVAGMREGRDGQELGGLAGRSSNRCDTTFEGCNAFLENIDSRLWASVL